MTMIDDIFKFFKEKKTDPHQLLAQAEAYRKKMLTKSGSIQVPVVRYFVRAVEGTSLDIENRERVLGFHSEGDTDPMGLALANVEIQKKKKKNKEEIGDTPPIEEESAPSEEEATTEGDTAKYGGTARVWAVPNQHVCEFVVVNGDVRTDIPPAHYHLVIMDPPFGLAKFAGDQEWSGEEVCFVLEFVFVTFCFSLQFWLWNICFIAGSCLLQHKVSF